MTAMSAARAHILYVSRLFGSAHGGSAYSTAMVEILRQAGADITLVTESGDDVAAAEIKGLKHLAMLHLFRSDPRSAVLRMVDIVQLWRVALAAPCTVVIIQGDLPRLNYVFLQRLVPLIFIRQDVILTCPANGRFLPASRSICAKPVGFSCLAVNRREGCLANLSVVHRTGRILYRLRDAFLLRRLRHFVVNSEYMAHCHRRAAFVLRPPNLSTPQPSNAAPRNLKHLVFCGRLEGTKGAEEAIKILAELPPEYQLHLLGGGPDKPMLIASSGTLGVADRVHFHGWVSSERRDALLAASGVLLLPSLVAEAFGMAGIEAFTQGTPVVAYDVGGISEWCLPEAGRLVSCGDLRAAAVAVQQITLSAECWSAFSSAARKVADTLHPPARFRNEVLAMMQSEAGLSLSSS